jgi:hypothetical protein
MNEEKNLHEEECTECCQQPLVENKNPQSLLL